MVIKDFVKRSRECGDDREASVPESTTDSIKWLVKTLKSVTHTLTHQETSRAEWVELENDGLYRQCFNEHIIMWTQREISVTYNQVLRSKARIIHNRVSYHRLHEAELHMLSGLYHSCGIFTGSSDGDRNYNSGPALLGFLGKK